MIGYLHTNNGRYSTDVLKHAHALFHEDWKDHLGTASVSVWVDADLFAKEPHPLLDWWVNLWYRNKPEDQCDFRRRAMWAFTAKIPAVIMFLVIKYFVMICAGTVLLLLAVDPRRIGWRALWHPFNLNIETFSNEIEADAFLLYTMRWNENLDTRALFLVAFSPLFFLATAGITAMIFGTPGNTGVFLTATVYHVYLLALGLAIFSLLLIVREVSTKKSRERRRFEQLQLEATPWFARPEADIDYLFAKQDTDVSFDIKSLPKPVRTIGLWFDGVKAEVCRPFAQ